MSDDAVKVVKEFYQAFSDGQLDRAFLLLDSQIDWRVVGPDTIPYFGNFVGHNGVMKFFAELTESVEYQRFEPREFLSGDNVVTVLGVEAGTMKATGEEFQTEWAHVFRVVDGKITGFVEYIDTVPLIVAYSA